MASGTQHTRNKSDFKTSRAAWDDILESITLKRSDIKETAHTDLMWVFIEK